MQHYRRKRYPQSFLNDGDLLVKLSCSSLTTNKNWHSYPLPEEIEKVLEIEWCSSTKCKNFYNKYNIKEIKDGYYYFLDRHSESKNKYDYSNINNRSSYNLTIALYNKENNELYFYEIDT